MPHPTATHRLGTALEAAAQRYGKALEARHQAEISALEARLLLARFGLPTNMVPPSGSDAPLLTSPERQGALHRLQAESRRLARFARVRHPAYDLDRHIAVRRLVAVLEPERPPALPSRAGPSSKDGGEAPTERRPLKRPCPKT